jgi:hypothetical protein
VDQDVRVVPQNAGVVAVVRFGRLLGVDGLIGRLGVQDEGRYSGGPRIRSRILVPTKVRSSLNEWREKRNDAHGKEAAVVIGAARFCVRAVKRGTSASLVLQLRTILGLERR